MTNKPSFEERLQKASQHKGKDSERDSPTQKQNIGKYSRFMHIGSEIIGGVLAGLLFGFMLDYFFKTNILFTALFAVLGIFIGLYNAYRYLMKITEAENTASKEKT